MIISKNKIILKFSSICMLYSKYLKANGNFVPIVSIYILLPKVKHLVTCFLLHNYTAILKSNRRNLLDPAFY